MNLFCDSNVEMSCFSLLYIIKLNIFGVLDIIKLFSDF